jgi:hypothetical protein
MVRAAVLLGVAVVAACAAARGGPADDPERRLDGGDTREPEARGVAGRRGPMPVGHERRVKRCHEVTADGRCAHFGVACSASELGEDPCLLDVSDRRMKRCRHVTADGR